MAQTADVAPCFDSVPGLAVTSGRCWLKRTLMPPDASPGTARFRRCRPCHALDDIPGPPPPLDRGRDRPLRFAGDYPFDVPMDTVPDPPSDWEPSSDDEDGDDDDDEYDGDGTEASEATDGGSRAAAHAEAVAAWRSEKREELLEDLICDEEPRWEQAVWAEDPVAADLVRGLLAKDPRARLSAAEALEHCWFTGHAAHDRATLKHVHTRVAALAASSEEPPVRPRRTRGTACTEVVGCAEECDLLWGQVAGVEVGGDGEIVAAL